MKKGIMIFLAKVCFSLLISLGAPLLIAWILQAGDSLLGMIIGIAVFNSLFLLKNLLKKGRLKSLVTVSILVFYILASLFIILYIVVIPYPSYMAWLDLVRAGRAGGIISFLFFVGMSYFSNLFGGLVYSAGILRPAAGVLVVVLFELAVVYQDLLSIVLFSTAIILAVSLLAVLPHKLKFKYLTSPLLLLLFVAALAGVLASGSKPNSGYLVGRILDPTIRRFLIEIFPDLPLLTDVAGYGYYYESEDLGDKPLLSNTPIFLIQGSPGESIYLRTQVYDYYYNNSWSLSLALSKWAEKNIAPLAGGEEPGARRIQVTLLHDYFNLLPHTLGADSVGIESQDPPKIAFGNIDTGFILDTPLLKGDSVVIESKEKKLTETPDFLVLSDVLKKSSGAEPVFRTENSPAYQEEILKHYLMIPNVARDKIRSVARNLRAGTKKPWEILANISRYLANNFLYTLNTNPAPAGEDFLEDFLFTSRKGYCVHFATAFIILARLNGIPARYASGFFIYIPQGENSTLVTGLQAHVWPEVWFPGLGWTIFEATPAIDLAALYNSEYYRLLNQENDVMTARQLEALMGKKIPLPAKPEVNIIGFILPCLLLLFGTGLLLLLLIAGIRFIKKHPPRKSPYKDNLKKLEKRLYKFVLKMNKENVPYPEKIGWIAWGRSVSKFFPRKKRAITLLVKIINRVFYNSYIPSKGDVRFLKLLQRRMGEL